MNAKIPDLPDDFLTSWHKADKRRMADLTIALHRVALEHGFLTFFQREQPEEMRNHSLVADQIRQELGVE